MFISGAVLLLLPSVVSSQWAWSPWPGTAASPPPPAPAQLTTMSYPANNVATAQVTSYTAPLAGGAQYVGPVSFTGATTTAVPRVGTATLDASQFNLGVAGLCGKGTDGCQTLGTPLASGQPLIPAPAPRIFGSGPSPSGSSGCSEGKSKSKGNSGGENCGCSEGKSKSKGNSGGENCGKSKGGKSGRSRGRTSVSYEALASDASTTHSQTFYYVAVGTTLAALVATTMMM